MAESKNTVLMDPQRGDENIQSVYFIGIGGIGMSAIARYYQARGAKVGGYDKTPTALTRQLEQEGIDVHYVDSVEQAPKDADIIVYTPAVPTDHAELKYYRANGYVVVKRSDILQLVTKTSYNICVAGTHGKTTITTMIAHLLRHSGYGCNAFLGGIAVNYDTNFWSSSNNVCVVEADEYDRSFLKLEPDIAVISAMDPDHLDIYGTAAAMEQAFIDFSGKVKGGGKLVAKFGLKRSKDLKAGSRISYSLQNESADAYAANIRMMNGSYEFDVMLEDNMLDNLQLHMGGMHNVENAVAAVAVASTLKIENDKIRSALADFKGVKRRFEYVIKTDRLVFIDDYAHHPEELKALISGAKSLFREKKCTVIFQPHLYSRTRDLAAGFASSLDLADEVILLPIYPARELPLEGVSSGMIVSGMENDHKHLMTTEQLMNWIENDFAKTVNEEFGEILITAGAGDIDMLVADIKKLLE